MPEVLVQEVHDGMQAIANGPSPGADFVALRTFIKDHSELASEAFFEELEAINTTADQTRRESARSGLEAAWHITPKDINPLVLELDDNVRLLTGCGAAAIFDHSGLLAYTIEEPNGRHPFEDDGIYPNYKDYVLSGAADGLFTARMWPKRHPYDPYDGHAPGLSGNLDFEAIEQAALFMPRHVSHHSENPNEPQIPQTIGQWYSTFEELSHGNGYESRITAIGTSGILGCDEWIEALECRYKEYTDRAIANGLLDVDIPKNRYAGLVDMTYAAYALENTTRQLLRDLVNMNLAGPSKEPELVNHLRGECISEPLLELGCSDSLDGPNIH